MVMAAEYLVRLGMKKGFSPGVVDGHTASLMEYLTIG